jgi:hypothetical protein
MGISGKDPGPLKTGGRKFATAGDKRLPVRILTGRIQTTGLAFHEKKIRQETGAVDPTQAVPFEL